MSDGRLYTSSDYAKLFKTNDKSIWRYMDFPKFVSMLKDESLFLTRADRFDDRLEGRLTEMTKMLMKEEIRIKDEEAMFVVHNLHMNDPEKYVEVLRERTYVSCWHKNDDESYLMWKAYSCTDFGVAIRSTRKRLWDSLLAAKDDIIISNVNYIDHENDITPYLPYMIFQTKSKRYTDERELRVFIMELGGKKASIGEERRTKFGLKIPVNLQTLIETIYVGPNAPDWFMDVVMETVKRFGFHDITVERSKL